jgi:prepilin-type N-terminal cleavage/methylation domain-containing protein
MTCIRYRRTSGDTSRDRSCTAPRRGVTLVEMLVAIVMIAVGAVSLMSVSGSIGRQMGSGMRQTVAASIAQARLDSLTSLACASLDAGAASGSAQSRGVLESWQVQDGHNIKTISVIITIPDRTLPLRYETIIPCRDL